MMNKILKKWYSVFLHSIRQNRLVCHYCEEGIRLECSSVDLVVSCEYRPQSSTHSCRLEIVSILWDYEGSANLAELEVHLRISVGLAGNTGDALPVEDLSSVAGHGRDHIDSMVELVVPG